MKKAIHLLIFSILFSSCAFYKPAKVNSPLLQEKGDGDVSINIGTGANVNVSFSPLNHVVLIGNYNNAYNTTLSTVNPTTGASTTIFNYTNSQFEVGGGYYNSKLFGKLYIDLIGGYGTGKCGTLADIGFFFFDEIGYQAKYRNHFIQSTFATNLDNPFIFGVGGKVNFLSFYDYKSTDKQSGYPEYSYFSVGSKVVFQPFVTLRYNSGFVGFETYLGLAFTGSSAYYTQRPFDIGIGLNFDIGKFRTHLKDKK
jgi:hypothetical protein